MDHSISILIPTHNRVDLLPKTLGSVRKVRVPDGHRVELVVIVNACTDSSYQVARECTRDWPYPVKVVEEPVAGLSQARDRGIRESSHAIIAFIDDDVQMEEQWMEGLLEVYANYPADIVGGRVDLWWDAVQRPDWVGRATEMLLSKLDLGNEVSERFRPGDIIGANFTYKRSLLSKVGSFRTDLGRKGSGLLAGEETEWAKRALAMGCRLFYAPRAGLKHWVAPKRVTPQYLEAYAFSMGLSRIAMRERFALPQICRALAGFSYLSCRHYGQELVATIRKDKRAYWDARIGRKIGNGGVVGAIRRMRGLPIEGRSS